MPDARYGERVAAFVVTKPGSNITLSDLMKHFTAQGASRQKVPEYLELVDELPRTGTGKLRKQELKLTSQGLDAGS